MYAVRCAQTWDSEVSGSCGELYLFASGPCPVAESNKEAVLDVGAGAPVSLLLLVYTVCKKRQLSR